MTLFAGDSQPGTTDGIGAAARFLHFNSLIVSSDGTVVWCGARGRMRRVNTKTREVTSSSQAYVRSMCWDRALTVKPDSAIYYSRGDTLLTRFDTISDAELEVEPLISWLESHGFNIETSDRSSHTVSVCILCGFRHGLLLQSGNGRGRTARTAAV